MKSLLIILSFTVLLAACEDEAEIQQGVAYNNLQDVTAGYDKLFRLDIDQDGDKVFYSPLYSLMVQQAISCNL